jgi:peptidoglycan/xylan/chitin deacetylase (PgdA/CDA1 family)
LKQSLTQTQEAIAQVCEVDLTYVQHNIRDVRPPNGLFTPHILQNLQQWNYRPVMWSVVPEDWVRPGVDVVIERVLNQICNGSLIVLHDGYHGGEDVAATVDRLIPTLLERGYQFVTVDRLWEQHTPTIAATITNQKQMNPAR